MKNPGEQFLHQRDQKLHTSDPVEHEQARLKRRGEETSQKPAEKLDAWMKVLERTHLGHRDDPKVVEKLKKHYYKHNVIKPEDVPESYFENQQRLAREQGHGDIEIEDNQRHELIEVIIADQESTLDNWLNYFMSEDSDSYPMRAKYWAFNGMLKLSTFDKEKHKFNKRTKDTVSPFADINREALAYVIDAVIKQATGEGVQVDAQDPEFQKILQGANFGKLYAWAIEKVTPAEEHELLTTEGQWVKYNQGDDHMPLVESLQGHGTGWCTAGESTAQTQLQNGDFYVYYSNNKQGSPSVPRVAIRMDGKDQIAEVRGIAPDQNLDPYIGDVADEKLKEFGREGEAYTKKSQDMKQLTEIDNRAKRGEELTKDDLRFLYEIDSKIQGFGYNEDPRIKEIINKRNVRQDLAGLLDCREDQISTKKEEALSGDIKYHHGNLYLNNLTSAEGLTLPKNVSGYLNLNGLTSAKGLTLPEHLGGGLYLRGLTSAKGLTLPESVGGYLDLSGLTSAEGLTLPESVGGYLDLSRLTSAEGLTLPKNVSGYLNLNNLTSAEGLTLPEHLGGGLYLSGLTSAEGLTLPEHVGGYLNLSGLTSAEGLTLPEHVGGGLYLRGLTSAKGLTLPEHLSGGLELNNLTSAEGLTLPEHVGGDLYLSSLTSAEGLNLPESCGGYLDLRGLTSAEGLTLPKNVSGYLDLNGLTSAEGLTLPEHLGGGLYLSGLTSAEDLTLPEHVGGNLHLSNLTSAEGLVLPESVGDDILLHSLSDIEKNTLRKKYPNLSIQ